MNSVVVHIFLCLLIHLSCHETTKFFFFSYFPAVTNIVFNTSSGGGPSNPHKQIGSEPKLFGFGSGGRATKILKLYGFDIFLDISRDVRL